MLSVTGNYLAELLYGDFLVGVRSIRKVFAGSKEDPDRLVAKEGVDLRSALTVPVVTIIFVRPYTGPPSVDHRRYAV